MWLNILSQTLDKVAEEMDAVAVKIGNLILLSPTALMCCCATVVAIAGLVIWHFRNPKK